MAFVSFTRQDFKTVFPDFQSWEDKLLSRVKSLYGVDTPAWLDDSKTFYSQRGIYNAMMLRYKKWFHKDSEEDFLDQFAIILGELLPQIHAKTLHLSADGIAQLSFENIMSNMRKDFLEDPDTKFLETIVEDILNSKGIVKTDNTTTEASTSIREEDNSLGGASTVSGTYSTPSGATGFGIDQNAQLNEKQVSIVKDDTKKKESTDSTGVFDGSMDTSQDNTRNARTKEVDKRVKVSTFADYAKGLKEITAMNFAGVIYLLVNDGLIVQLFVAPTPENLEGYVVAGSGYTDEEIDTKFDEKADTNYVNNEIDKVKLSIKEYANMPILALTGTLATGFKAEFGSTSKSDWELPKDTSTDYFPVMMVGTAFNTITEPTDVTVTIKDSKGKTMPIQIRVGYTNTAIGAANTNFYVVACNSAFADVIVVNSGHNHNAADLIGYENLVKVGTVYNKQEEDIFHQVLGEATIKAMDNATLGTKEWDAYEKAGTNNTYELNLSTDINKYVLSKNKLFNVWFAPNSQLDLEQYAFIKIIEFAPTTLIEQTYAIYIDDSNTHYRAKVKEIANCATEMLIWQIIKDGDAENRVVLTLNKTGIIREVKKIADKADKTEVAADLNKKLDKTTYETDKNAQAIRDIDQDVEIAKKLENIIVKDSANLGTSYQVKEIIAGNNISVTQTANGVRFDVTTDFTTYATASWELFNHTNQVFAANIAQDLHIQYVTGTNTDPNILQTNGNLWQIVDNGRAKFYDMVFELNPNQPNTTMTWQWFVEGVNVGGTHTELLANQGIQQFQVPGIILNLPNANNIVTLRITFNKATTIIAANTVGFIDVIENIGIGSSGDMEKATYDSNNNGKVDNAEHADTAAEAANALKLDGFDWSRIANPNTIVLRDANSRVRTGTPATAQDAIPLEWLQTNYTTSQALAGLLLGKANADETYTTSAVDNLLNGKANSSHTHFASQITDLSPLLNAKAPTANPTFTGSVALPALSAVSYDGIALNSILSGYVGVGGNQTIVGTKTFTASPNVPTPVNATEATNKNYVDTNFVLGRLETGTIGTTGKYEKITRTRFGEEQIAEYIAEFTGGATDTTISLATLPKGIYKVYTPGVGGGYADYVQTVSVSGRRIRLSDGNIGDYAILRVFLKDRNNEWIISDTSIRALFDGPEKGYADHNSLNIILRAGFKYIFKQIA